MSTQIIDLPAGNRLYVSSTQGGGDYDDTTWYSVPLVAS